MGFTALSPGRPTRRRTYVLATPGGPFVARLLTQPNSFQYEIYLFESILLCCKEGSPNKSRDKKDKTRSTGPKIRNKNAKLHMKGRIFMTNVTDVVTLSKPGLCPLHGRALGGANIVPSRDRIA